jgi:hypothetical protein
MQHGRRQFQLDSRMSSHTVLASRRLAFQRWATAVVTWQNGEGQAVVTYKGIVRGKVIELEGNVALPEGAEVEVMVKVSPNEALAPSGYPKGSPQAISAAVDVPARCSPEDVDALLEAIELGVRPASNRIA